MTYIDKTLGGQRETVRGYQQEFILGIKPLHLMMKQGTEYLTSLATRSRWDAEFKCELPWGWPLDLVNRIFYTNEAGHEVRISVICDDFALCTTANPKVQSPSQISLHQQSPSTKNECSGTYCMLENAKLIDFDTYRCTLPSTTVGSGT
jgi:hypothetical protein